MTPPVIWSIAGNDSGGGAGLAADARAAAAFGVHLCPVVAAITAQNSQAVSRIDPVAPDLLDAQLAALAADMPPVAIKTGALGSAENVAIVARWVDRLREQHDVALVVDPVLGASTGAAFVDAATLTAYREQLLPRASLLVPNCAEAERLLGGMNAADMVGTADVTAAHDVAAAPDDATISEIVTDVALPELAARLQQAGAKAVAITGGDAAPGSAAGSTFWAADWIATPHAAGWLALPRVHTLHTHGTGCTFASSAASALALGFDVADALVLAKMATTRALQQGRPAGNGAGPVLAEAGFATDPALMPVMTWGDEPLPPSVPGPGRHDWPPLQQNASVAGSSPADAATQPIVHRRCDLAGLYAIVSSNERLQQVLAAGARLVQVRIKTPPRTSRTWQADLRRALTDALAACRQHGATLVVNDHWQLALELAASDARGLALHLGQEDLQELSAAERAQLRAGAVPLGISSHSLWELARARSVAPWYVACGPVWPTLTKKMPWRPQGLDNLAWWVRMAGTPVVAIGGILEHAQASWAARAGAAAVCIVRGLGDDPDQSWPYWRAAVQSAAGLPSQPAPALPHPTLEISHGR